VHNKKLLVNLKAVQQVHTALHTSCSLTWSLSTCGPWSTSPKGSPTRLQGGGGTRGAREGVWVCVCMDKWIHTMCADECFWYGREYRVQMRSCMLGGGKYSTCMPSIEQLQGQCTEASKRLGACMQVCPACNNTGSPSPPPPLLLPAPSCLPTPTHAHLFLAVSTCLCTPGPQVFNPLSNTSRR
jgi:hypothetical protein